MALQPREKKLLKILAVTAVVSGVGLYFIYNPGGQGEIITEETITSSENQRTTSSAPRPSAGRGGLVRPSSTQAKTSSSSNISLEVFSSNNRLESCWVLMKGRVINITDFLHQYTEYQKNVEELCGGFGFDTYLQENPSLIPLIQKYGSDIGEIN